MTTTHCEHCQATAHPVWQLVEVYPERTYELLCRRCRAQRDREFTAELAIAQALIIIGRLNVREVRG